jgi:hypothetical protein
MELQCNTAPSMPKRKSCPLRKGAAARGCAKEPGVFNSSHFVLLLLAADSIAMWIFGDGAGSGLQAATVAVFAVCLIAGFLFYRDLPDFKISMQAFMQSQKKWKCRDCSHEWES